MTVTIDGSAGITTPGVTDTGNLSVTGTSSLTGAVTQTGSSTAASFIPTGSSVPTNGMYLSAANTVNIATNSTNQVAISSTGIVTGTAGNLMLIQGTSQASTSGTSIDFTGIPSWAKRIIVMFNGVSTNGTSKLILQLGSGSVTSSGYLGACVQTVDLNTPTGVNNSSGFQLDNATNAAGIRYGQIVLALISGNTWTQTGIVSRSDTAAVSNSGGVIALSGTLDRVRITTVNGTDTFDAGSINIQYE